MLDTMPGAMVKDVIFDLMELMDLAAQYIMGAAWTLELNRAG